MNFEAEMMGKWLQLLKEISPRIVRVALLFNPETLSKPPRRNSASSRLRHRCAMALAWRAPSLHLRASQIAD